MFYKTRTVQKKIPTDASLEGMNVLSSSGNERPEVIKTYDHIMFMLFFGLLLIIAVGLLVTLHPAFSKEHVIWFARIVIALSAAAISMSLTGAIEVKTQNWKDKQTAQKEAGASDTPNVNTADSSTESFASKYPAISASGALAVFVLIYLVDPIATYIGGK